MTGKLRVEKTIAGPAARRQGAVTIEVSCDGQRLPDFLIRAATPAGTRSQTYENIPAGAVCVVDEAKNGHSARIAVTVNGNGQHVRIPANHAATVKLTDTYHIAVRPRPRPPSVTG